MIPFVIFPFKHDGKVYVEAYPLNNRPRDVILGLAPAGYWLVEAVSRNQAFPYMGGLVSQGGRLIGRTDAQSMEPAAGEPVFATTEHLATLLSFLAIDSQDVWPGVEPTDVMF